jgi:cysteine desulfurase family protein (TIGR01976 family)
MSYDVERIRSEFPGLAREEGGRPVVFFDNPAGTQVARRCVERMVEAMVTSNANVGGPFKTSIEAGERLHEAHVAAADFVNAASPDEIFFGQSMTAVTFMVSRCIGRELKPGDEIVLTRMDHDGNVGPWLMLAEDHGLEVRWLDFDPATFEYDMASLERALGPRTRVVAVNHASNVTGTINDVRAIAHAAKAVDALVYVDAVQSAPHLPIDVRALGCDFLVCSAYKFYGPHFAVTWGRRELLERLTAYKVRPAPSTLPGKFVNGTTSRESAAGVRGAIEHFEWVGREFGGATGAGATRRQRIVAGAEAMRAHDRMLAERLIAGLASAPGVRILGLTRREEMAQRVPTVSFDLEGHDPANIARFMAANGINLWHGHNYGVEPVRRLGLLEKGGVVRVGPTHYNTPAEIDRFLETFQRYRASNSKVA